LNRVDLAPDAAAAAYATVRADIETMLARGLVHGDLSPFNILWHQGRAVIIDLPQVVRPDQHRGVFDIFARDVARVLRYFNDRGVGDDPAALAEKLWQRHVRGDVWVADWLPPES
jgi:RIO kinase 1